MRQVEQSTEINNESVNPARPVGVKNHHRHHGYLL